MGSTELSNDSMKKVVDIKKMSIAEELARNRNKVRNSNGMKETPESPVSSNNDNNNKTESKLRISSLLSESTPASVTTSLDTSSIQTNNVHSTPSTSTTTSNSQNTANNDTSFHRALSPVNALLNEPIQQTPIVAKTIDIVSTPKIIQEGNNNTAHKPIKAIKSHSIASSKPSTTAQSLKKKLLNSSNSMTSDTDKKSISTNSTATTSPTATPKVPVTTKRHLKPSANTTISKKRMKTPGKQSLNTQMVSKSTTSKPSTSTSLLDVFEREKKNVDQSEQPIVILDIPLIDNDQLTDENGQISFNFQSMINNQTKDSTTIISVPSNKKAKRNLLGQLNDPTLGANKKFNYVAGDVDDDDLAIEELADDDEPDDDIIEEDDNLIIAENQQTETSPKKRSHPNKGKSLIGKYDVEDPFIDDAELLLEEQQASTNDGFFVYYGPLIETGHYAKFQKVDGTFKKGGIRY